MEPHLRPSHPQLTHNHSNHTTHPTQYMKHPPVRSWPKTAPQKLLSDPLGSYSVSEFSNLNFFSQGEGQEGSREAVSTTGWGISRGVRSATGPQALQGRCHRRVRHFETLHKSPYPTSWGSKQGKLPTVTGCKGVKTGRIRQLKFRRNP